MLKSIISRLRWSEVVFNGIKLYLHLHKAAIQLVEFFKVQPTSSMQFNSETVPRMQEMHYV